MRKTLVAAAAVIAVASGALIGQASAADLDYMPAPAPAPPPFVPTWAGFYVGGHVGYGEGTSDFRQDLDFDAGADGVFEDFNTFRSGTNPDGILGGVQGGYNWQAGSFVFGVEGDISFADWGASSTLFDSNVDTIDGLLVDEDTFGTASTDIDFLASVRGRIGYAMDSVLIYGTGGVAWADAEARASVYFDPDDTDGVAGDTVSAKSDLNDIGFVAGAGLAWMVIPQTMSVGVEGLYYWFSESETLIDETFPIGTDDAAVFATAELHDAWVVRARADFHF